MPYKTEIEKKMNRVIGVNDHLLEAELPESPLSNFVADIMQGKTSNYLIKNKAKLRYSNCIIAFKL